MFEFSALSQFSIALFIYHDLCQGQSIQGQGRVNLSNCSLIGSHTLSVRRNHRHASHLLNSTELVDAITEV